MRHAGKRLVLLWMLSVSACVAEAGTDAQGGQDAAVSDPADASGDGDGESWPFDTACPGTTGLSGAAVVASIASPYADTLIYLDTTETTAMQLTLTHEGGDVTCFPSIAQELPPRLQVIMVVTLRTDDGVFDETLEATVESYGGAPTFTSQEPLAEVEGTWAPESASMFGPNPWLEISGNLFPTDTNGNVRLHGDGPSWAATAW